MWGDDGWGDAKGEVPACAGTTMPVRVDQIKACRGDNPMQVS